MHFQHCGNKQDFCSEIETLNYQTTDVRPVLLVFSILHLTNLTKAVVGKTRLSCPKYFAVEKSA